jgi:PIN domain nuclease of toxin-antitoxin system
MNYLVDTSIFIWSVGPADRLNREARELIKDTSEHLFFSAASAWEISIKHALGKLRLPESPSTYVPKRVQARGMRLLPILNHHALLAGELPMHHFDPFDRMLIAQAKSEGLTLMTADRTFKRYDVDILWSGR